MSITEMMILDNAERVVRSTLSRLHIIERLEALEAAVLHPSPPAKENTAPTREAPIRGTVGEYQDWLVEQLRAGVDWEALDATVNDIAWAEWVIRAEERAERRKNFILGLDCGGAAPGRCPDCRFSNHGEATDDCQRQRALADDPPTPQEKNR